MVHKTILLPEKDVSLFLELIKHFHWKEANQPVSQNESDAVPDWHKAETLKRIKNSKLENLLDWNEVKDNFKLD